MLPIATDVARRVVCVCLYAVHMDELCQNSWTDWDAVGDDSRGRKEPRIRWGRDPHEMGQF